MLITSVLRILENFPCFHFYTDIFRHENIFSIRNNRQMSSIAYETAEKSPYYTCTSASIILHSYSRLAMTFAAGIRACLAHDD